MMFYFYYLQTRPLLILTLLQNISFKSHSRDSGHGGSEQEDSPRSHAIIDARLNHAKDTRRQPFIPNDFNNQVVGTNLQQQDFANYTHRNDTIIQHPKHLQLPQNYQPHGLRKKNGSFLRSGSPWNHTYTEIHEQRLQKGLVVEDDPVYEEIEHNDLQVSDMSDEDGKRQSDMSRQSSRSYGDHRPLIPYSPATDRNICWNEMEYRLMRQNMYRGDARSLAAVLDGETVVCHLEPPEMSPQGSFTSRTLYTES